MKPELMEELINYREKESREAENIIAGYSSLKPIPLNFEFSETGEIIQKSLEDIVILILENLDQKSSYHENDLSYQVKGIIKEKIGHYLSQKDVKFIIKMLESLGFLTQKIIEEQFDFNVFYFPTKRSNKFILKSIENKIDKGLTFVEDKNSVNRI